MATAWWALPNEFTAPSLLGKSLQVPGIRPRTQNFAEFFSLEKFPAVSANLNLYAHIHIVGFSHIHNPSKGRLSRVFEAHGSIRPQKKFGKRNFRLDCILFIFINISPLIPPLRYSGGISGSRWWPGCGAGTSWARTPDPRPVGGSKLRR